MSYDLGEMLSVTHHTFFVQTIHAPLPLVWSPSACSIYLVKTGAIELREEVCCASNVTKMSHSCGVSAMPV